MEFVNDLEFDEYIEQYKKLPLSDKKKYAEEQLHELISFLDTLNDKYGKDSKLLFNREILDLKKENHTEDDFVEAIFVYCYMIKELISSWVDGMEGK